MKVGPALIGDHTEHMGPRWYARARPIGPLGYEMHLRLKVVESAYDGGHKNRLP